MSASKFVTLRLDAIIHFFAFSMILFPRPLETEVWNFEKQSSKIISPILPDGQYAMGLGLYIVDPDFCKK